ncbi:MAG: DNA alkylation repair protein [Abditibacteriota bacterium]|nr:DNA alkylation repair protein [Abditibacteriota bacterium]
MAEDGITGYIRQELSRRRDPDYGAFQQKLIPAVAPASIIGVRTPELRSLAKELVGRGDLAEFLEALPHAYFDENQLHAFIISETRDYGLCMSRTCRFLPFIDNWATCDQLSPKCFAKHRPELLEHIRGWLGSGQTYTVRFGIGMLMQHYLDEAFLPEYPGLVAGIRSGEYYVNMMSAWYFATALAKQYRAVLCYLEDRLLDPRVHNAAIQKALESRRITQEQKQYLRTLKNRRQK